MNQPLGPHPNPRENPLAFYEWLGDAAEAILGYIQQQHSGRRVSASEAARELGYNPRFFHGRPWRIPGYGLKGTMHTLAEWEDWIARPEAERRSEWETMPLNQKRNARGVA